MHTEMPINEMELEAEATREGCMINIQQEVLERQKFYKCGEKVYP